MRRSSMYAHPEAFCLMKYASADGRIVEWIWNSRDGVTPFMIRSADGATELQHVDWQLDRCLPLYQPAPGERVFVDSTEARMRPRVEAYVTKYWNDPMSGMAAAFTSQAAAIATLLPQWNRPGSPIVMTAREAGLSVSDDPPQAPEQP